MAAQEGTTHYSKLIYENTEKFYQLHLTVSEFREKYYLNLRKYFQSFEGEFIPSRDGVSMEMTIDNIRTLLDSILDVLSKAEGEYIIKEYADKVLGKGASQ